MSDATPSLPAAPIGWYPDPSDPAILRWWDGFAWGEFTAPRAPQLSDLPAPTSAPLPASLTNGPENKLATRGMIYSLVSLGFNLLLVPSIAGLVTGIRALRRVPDFAPERAHRSRAIAAIVIGAVTTVITSIALVVAVQSFQARTAPQNTFDQVTLQQQLLSDWNNFPGIKATAVDCPRFPSSTPGAVFECVATLTDLNRVRIQVTLGKGRIFSWVTMGYTVPLTTS